MSVAFHMASGHNVRKPSSWEGEVLREEERQGDAFCLAGEFPVDTAQAELEHSPLNSSPLHSSISQSGKAKPGLWS